MENLSMLTKYKTTPRRVMAAIIDGFIFWPIAYFLNLIPNNEGYAAVAIELLSLIIYIFYVVALTTKYGGTIGKLLMNVRVFDISESRYANTKQVLIRESVGIIFSMCTSAFMLHEMMNGAKHNEITLNPFYLFLAYGFLSWSILEIITTLTNSKRRAIHDFMANTVIIHNMKVPPITYPKIDTKTSDPI
jgi:uncharacterized RDD family membrane protein YckC